MDVTRSVTVVLQVQSDQPRDEMIPHLMRELERVRTSWLDGCVRVVGAHEALSAPLATAEPSCPVCLRMGVAHPGQRERKGTWTCGHSVAR